ncbi:MAG: hypothetical protein U0694_15260 [Anaerolineae bacterium]
MRAWLKVVMAAAAGLVGALLVYPIAAAAPARYIGSFTAPWFAQASPFLVVIIPPALTLSKLHRVPGMRRVTFFVGGIVCLGALTGLYMAWRWAYESHGSVADWLMVIFGSMLLLGGTIALIYWAMQE